MKTFEISNLSPQVIDEMYQKYINNPQDVDESWLSFFQGFDLAQNFSHFQSSSHQKNNIQKQPVQQVQQVQQVQPVIQHHNSLQPRAQYATIDEELRLVQLIEGYRARGHLFSRTNPIRARRQFFPKIEPSLYQFSDEDMDKLFIGGSNVQLGIAPLKKIIAHLDQIYCSSIGCEYRFIRLPPMLDWIEKRVESVKSKTEFSNQAKKKILHKLNETVLFEQFLQSRFVGQKRFSLEGIESFIPALESLLSYGVEKGIKEYVIGMAHRGRLNVLVNIFKKSYEQVFSEFLSKGYDTDEYEGDVKYHLGWSSDRYVNNKKIHLSLLPNPSHLEAIDPIVEGVVHSKLFHRYNNDSNKIVPILIHGDSSIAGQGIIYELIQMSELNGFANGGTVHIVLNNQIGFTTNYRESRSSTYCTDVAKVSKSPVFHVNGDDVEAVVHAVQFALEFRQTFKKDVFLDIVGYRRYGHNESDDPKFTQPKLYDIISKHKNLLEIYSQKLIDERVINESYKKNIANELMQQLDFDFEKAKKIDSLPLNSFLKEDWIDIYRPTAQDIYTSPLSGIDSKKFDLIAKKINTLPDNIKFYRKLRDIYNKRYTHIFEKNIIDWGTGEALAYGSLLSEGKEIRLCGEDVKRGTFSHRHAVLLSEDEEKVYIPLEKVAENSRITIINSLLSEYAVLGFEYGYSWASPQCLNIWEAQFGDFANCAQVIIDQFISSSETKWQRMSGITLFLPHGYEGQGPEHSSARIERYLELCARDNMIVANCTTPANLFHILRRQLIRNFRKPLILITPKSILRHPRCVSHKADFVGATRFQEVLMNNLCPNKDEVKRIIFCSGKLYYDLTDYQIKKQISNIEVIRLEQLYPLVNKRISAIVKKYKNINEIFWAQEEPENMGAWNFIHRKMNIFDFTLQLISRKENSNPATGFSTKHKKEQNQIIQLAMTLHGQ